MFMFMSMGGEDVSELRPPMGLLFIPRMIYEYGGRWWYDTDRETEELRNNLYPCHFVYHKCHMD
jgi:hypothetical protein